MGEKEEENETEDGEQELPVVGRPSQRSCPSEHWFALGLSFPPREYGNWAGTGRDV